MFVRICDLVVSNQILMSVSEFTFKQHGKSSEYIPHIRYILMLDAKEAYNQYNLLGCKCKIEL